LGEKYCGRSVVIVGLETNMQEVLKGTQVTLIIEMREVLGLD